jgi:hypothetical protein
MFKVQVGNQSVTSSGFPFKPILKQQLLGWQEELTANFKVELLIYKIISDKITFAKTRVRRNIQIPIICI